MSQVEVPLYSQVYTPPQLPFELICTIIEQTLSEFSIILPGGPEVKASPIPQHLLTLNRDLYSVVIKIAYRTIVVSSSRSLENLFYFVNRLPHLAKFVRNLWIGTHRLEAFDHQFGWAPYVIAHILTCLPGLERLALPTAFLPPTLGTLDTPVKHITFGGGSITCLSRKVQDIHVYGLIEPSQTHLLKSGPLKRVVCELERPCAPGAVGHLVHEFLVNRAEEIEPGARMGLVVPERIKAWFEEEASQIRTEDLLEGSLIIHPENVAFGSRCDMWVWGCNKF